MSVNPARQSPDAIVLLNFIRAGLTEEALESLLDAGGTELIFASVEAPFGSSDQMRRQRAVLSVIDDMATRYRRVVPRIAAPNIGIVSHALGALAEANRRGARRLVLLEDDLRLGRGGLDFLLAAVDEAPPAHAVAYTPSEHFPYGVETRLVTPFPTQWGIGLNDALLSLIRQVPWSRAFVPETYWIGKFLEPYIHSGIRRQWTASYWSSFFKQIWGDPHHFDALLQYTCWTNGITTKVPMNSLCSDVGGGENSFSGRSTFTAERHTPSIRLDPSRNPFCQECQIVSLRRRSVTLSMSLRYRLELGKALRKRPTLRKR